MLVVGGSIARRRFTGCPRQNRQGIMTAPNPVMKNPENRKKDPHAAAVPAEIIAVEGRTSRRGSDEVACEEPVEIRVVEPAKQPPARHSIAVTMRTPGNDFELAAGFLFSEGVLKSRESIQKIEYCGESSGAAQFNVVNVVLAPGTPFDPRKFTRNVYTSSSCGICGKTSLEMVRSVCPAPPTGTLRLNRDLLRSLPGKLSSAQAIFSRTGGLHASALFDGKGKLLLMREDVGRHNAMDKVIGRLFLEGRLPASGTAILVSGRASFELIQKALMAGIPILAAVGAPSSLAIDMAREFGMTLIGFLRDGRFNIYAGEDRIDLD